MQLIKMFNDVTTISTKSNGSQGDWSSHKMMVWHVLVRAKIDEFAMVTGSRISAQLSAVPPIRHDSELVPSVFYAQNIFP
jgi:hypothetical protein